MLKQKFKYKKLTKVMKKFLKCLKQSKDEDFEFCEQLMKLCPDKDFLVKFCSQREEELDSIIDDYEKRLTPNLSWEVAIAYFGKKLLYDAVTEKYGY
jgi:hypothetical protein